MPKIFTDEDRKYFIEVVNYLHKADRPKYENTANYFASKYPDKKSLNKKAIQRMEIWVNDNSGSKIEMGQKGDTKKGHNQSKRIPEVNTIEINTELLEEDSEIGTEKGHINGTESGQKKTDPKINVGPADPSRILQLSLSQKNSDLQIHDALKALTQYQRRLSNLSCNSAKAIAKEIKETILNNLEDPLK